MRAAWHVAVGGVQLVPDAVALLLVGRDALASAADDGLQLEQFLPGFAEALAALLTHVGAGVGLVVVTTGLTHLEPAAHDVSRSVTTVAARQRDAGDLVAGTLVLDQGVGPELANGQEAGALEPRALRSPARTGDVGRQGQPGEGVPGEETLRGEVAVGVEVGLAASVGLVQQQLDPLTASIRRRSASRRSSLLLEWSAASLSARSRSVAAER